MQLWNYISHEVDTVMAGRKTYDAGERESIRQRLLQYKLRYGIGCPTLSKRIHAANPHIRMIDQRRVSRFLARQHQPEDMFVSWCETFLQTVPDRPSDPFRTLADGMLEFCGKHEGPDYTGAYTLALKENADKPPELPSAEWSVTPGDGFWRVEERPINRHIILDGVLVNTPGSGTAVLKDRLTGMTRTVVLLQHEGALLGRSQGVNMTREYTSYLFHLEKRP